MVVCSEKNGSDVVNNRPDLNETKYIWLNTPEQNASQITTLEIQLFSVNMKQSANIPIKHISLTQSRKTHRNANEDIKDYI